MSDWKPVADDYAYIANKMKEIKEQREKAISNTGVEPKVETPPKPYSDDFYYCG